MKPARPRPNADFLDRRRIDGDDNDIARGRARQPGETEVGERVTQPVVPARGQRDGQNGGDQNMWPNMLQFPHPPRPQTFGPWPCQLMLAVPVASAVSFATVAVAVGAVGVLVGIPVGAVAN